jgi:DNA-binding ferritin-like protein
MDDTSLPEKPKTDVAPEDAVDSKNSDAVQTLLSVEKIIKSLMSRIERLKEDQKPINEMLNNLLNNNEEYSIAADEAKEASKKKSAIKKKILSTSEGKMADDKVRGIKNELKEARESLSSYLADYQKLTGSSEFEGDDGELRQIVYVAKLVRKTNLER